MNVLGLIPARGGSKGIPRKNIVPLGGKPLIAWTIEAARQAQGVSRVVVSTDDAEIAAVARQWGAEVPFMRPREIATDGAVALPVIRHAVETLERQHGWCSDAVAYLQPTSPFRRAEDIDAAIALLHTADADTVVSVTRVPHNMLPDSLMRQDEDGTLAFVAPPELRRFRRQEKENVLFARNGPAILLMRRAVLEAGNLYGQRILPVTMERLRSLDIDEPLDLEIAEALLPLIAGQNGDL